VSLFSELQRRNVFRVAAAYLVVGWLLVEVTTTLLPLFGAPDWVSRVLVFIIVLGFAPAIIVSWVYELTPEGIKRESEVDRDASITGMTARRLNYITIAAVIVGAALVAWLRLGEVPEANAPVVDEIVATEVDDSSVAVLPFVNMSGNADNEYFSDGLTETLLHMLAQVPELKVAARTSSFAFKGQDRDIRDIADALDVAHVLEGSVQRAGDRVRITVQLIRASDGFHIWSENYDRTLDDIFGIQDDIAGRVGAALSASLLSGSQKSPIVGVGTSDIAAYDDYLHALSALASGSFSGYREAEQALQAALAKDPDFVDAKVRLADVYISQSETGMTSKTDAYRDALSLLQQALQARPDDINAQSLLLKLKLSDFNIAGVAADYAASKAKLQALIQRSPNEPAPKVALASILRSSDEQRITLLQSVVSIDPLNPQAHYDLAAAAYHQSKCELAARAATRSLELASGQPNAYTLLARCALLDLDATGWLENFHEAMRLDPQDHELPAHIAEALFRLGLLEPAHHYLRRAKAIKPNAPYVRYVEFIGIDAEFGTAEGIPAAWALVEEDIEDRKGSWFEPMMYLMMVGASNGTLLDTLKRLDKTYPGFSDLSRTDLSMRARLMRLDAAGLWAGPYDQDELLAYMRREGEWLASIGLPPPVPFDLKLLEGDLDGAVEVVEQDFLTGSVPLEWPWRLYLQCPSYASVSAHPRIAALMQRWSEEEQQIREQLVTYFEQHPLEE